MKKILLPVAIIMIFALAACGGDVNTESLVEDASNAAAGVVDSVNDELSETAVAPAATDEPEPMEEEAMGEDAAADGHEATCDPADVAAPTIGDVTIRFVNASGGEIAGVWRDTSQSPAQETEYFQAANGEFYDQETFVGHEWFVKDKDGKTKDYVATAEVAQCVIIYHWGYEGEGAPQNWADLRTEYETCGIGQEQSPIDLTAASMTDLENIVFNYGETAVNILNNGHTIQVDKVEGNQIEIDGETYQLAQFHFHAPSEHTVDGSPYPVEMHLVHSRPNPTPDDPDRVKLAVVGVFIADGAENAAFTPVWDHLPAKETKAVATGATVNVAALLPADQMVYRYNGSLTTPPCSQDVLWSVMVNPVEMSTAQIAAFTKIIKDNNRPLQPLNARDLQLDESP